MKPAFFRGTFVGLTLFPLRPLLLHALLLLFLLRALLRLLLILLRTLLL